MPGRSDLFGYGPAQGSLFGGDDGRLQTPVQNTTPDPDKVRQRLISLIEKARSAARMPWPEHQARVWQFVFPNMAKWLPEDEAQQLSFEFAREMERLNRAA